MRRRTIIATVITIITVISCNKLWLDFKPMTVDLDIKGNGICNIEVQLNKKNNDKFNKIKSQAKKINLDKSSHIKFMVQKSNFPKRIRIVFKNLNDNPIEIKNITLRNGKYKLDDLKNFTINTGKLTVNKNTIQITPPLSANSIILTYNKKINARTSLNFDFMIFIVILVLTYLLAYKLTDYAADFKTVQNKSRIEIVFLALFFIILFIPMTYINQERFSKNENRTLATYKPLFKKDNKINYNFGKDYNNWFNDRFFPRQFLLDIQTRISLILTGKTAKGYIDKDFVYFNHEVDHSGLKEINKQDYDALVNLDKYFKDRNIKLYILLGPDKGYIYPSSEKLLIKDEYDKIIGKTINELNTKHNMHIINPIKAMQNGAKDHYMFFKTEHHWTSDGAFVVYKELMKEITKDNENIYTLQESDFNFSENNLITAELTRTRVFDYGQTSRFINLPKDYIKKLHKTKYRYYTHKDSNLLKMVGKNIPYHRNRQFFYPKGADYRVVVIGTSIIDNLSEFIPYTFKNTFVIRNNVVKKISPAEEFKIMKYYEKEILDYKPDIIIYCVNYHLMPNLNNLLNKE